MTPWEYLKQWAAENRGPADMIAGAVALFAAVYVVTGWGSKPEALVPSAIYVGVIGFALVVVGRLLMETWAMRALALFAGALAVLWVLALIWSRLDPANERLACLVYFWRPCTITADQVAAAQIGNDVVVVDTAKPSDGEGTFPSDAKSRYKVFIQFAGYKRETIVDLANVLAGENWSVQGSDRGGERVASAHDLAQVRYHPGDEDAAEALAASITATGIKSVRATPVQVVKPGILEVWIGL